jgi:hypothetical protein
LIEKQWPTIVTKDIKRPKFIEIFYRTKNEILNI